MKTKNDLKIPFSWEERQPVFLERLFYLPKQFDEYETWGRIAWNDERVFGNDRPVCIELCSGNGQWIAERALERADCNWVAVEMDFDRARKIWLKVFREKIPNLYVVCGEGTTFLRYYAPKKSVVASYVNFPDPWPKTRHAKHRIVQQPFLHALSEVVMSGGKAIFVTDDPPYRDQMVRELNKAPFWSSAIEAPHYHSDLSTYGESYFRNLWQSKGMEIYYIEYVND